LTPVVPRPGRPRGTATVGEDSLPADWPADRDQRRDVGHAPSL